MGRRMVGDRDSEEEGARKDPAPSPESNQRRPACSQRLQPTEGGAIPASTYTNMRLTTTSPDQKVH